MEFFAVADHCVVVVAADPEAALKMLMIPSMPLAALHGTSLAARGRIHAAYTQSAAVAAATLRHATPIVSATATGIPYAT